MATIRVDGDATEVKVLHEGRKPYRKLPNPKDPSIGLPDSDTASFYSPFWIAAFPSQKSRTLFVGRNVGPMAVDLSTGQANALTFEPGAAQSVGKMLVSGNRIFKSYGTGVVELKFSEANRDLVLEKQIINSIPRGTVPDWVDEAPNLAEYNGWIYKPGVVWYRFRPDGTNVQRLTGAEGLQPHEYDQVGVSSEFGLVAWSRHSYAALYKVSVEE
ncbi:MAG: hypothetical protein U0892_19550 [Pirellulales bacterium]